MKIAAALLLLIPIPAHHHHPPRVTRHHAPQTLPTAPTGLPRGEAGRPVGTAALPVIPDARSRVAGRAATRTRRMPPVVHGTLLDVTCYAATGHLTASGKVPRVGMAASNRWPFGTRLRVRTVGTVVVEDRIGHGTDLDLFGPSEAFCRRFGRHHLRVEVTR